MAERGFAGGDFFEFGRSTALLWNRFGGRLVLRVVFLSRFGFGMMFAAMLFAVRWRQLRIKTGPEYFQLRFHSGRKFVRVYTSLSSVLIGIIPWIGAGLLGIHMVMAPIFHFSNISTTLLLVLPLLIVYVWIGGFAGVLLTDLFQSCVILLANLALVVSVLYCFGGPSGLADAVAADVQVLEKPGRGR